jgi:hypothetical protein
MGDIPRVRVLHTIDVPAVRVIAMINMSKKGK